MKFVGIDLTSAFVAAPRPIDIAVLDDFLNARFFAVAWPSAEVVISRESTFLTQMLLAKIKKIRHYGILSNRKGIDKLPICKEILGISGKSKIPGFGAEDNEWGDEKESWEDLLFRITGVDPRVCPHCGKGKMVRREKLEPRRSRCPP